MKSPAPDTATRDRLRAQIEAIDGVQKVVLEGPPLVAYVICAERNDSSPVELLVRAVLAREGLEASSVDVRICYLVSTQAPRRVRFLHSRLQRRTAGRVVASVGLEWAGAEYEREVEGESSGGPMELRLAALATLRTLEAVIGGVLEFRLLGIRALRAFDADLIVVLLKTEHSATPLIGASLATDDPFRSASVAVLNATNRILGNYLVTHN
ncbi:MAG: hypothetical protein JO040_10480 [Gemmatimonadetes bacterium]|nr:hypothetical protein [Gemmatimonadota bacterium]